MLLNTAHTSFENQLTHTFGALDSYGWPVYGDDLENARRAHGDNSVADLQHDASLYPDPSDSACWE